MVTNPGETDVGAPMEPDDSTRVTATETGTGLDDNVAGALAYLLGIVTGVVFYVLEPDNEFVRFHAAQSIAISAVFFVAGLVVAFLGTILSALFFSGSMGGFLVGGFLSLVLSLVWFVVLIAGFALWLYLMYQAYQGNTPRIPIAAGLADRLL
ncbi:MAG: DUF4870 domain-containing protein [Halapricum sp.]